MLTPELNHYCAKTDYPLLADWWGKREGWQAVPQQILPKTGYLVSIGEKPILAGFLYLAHPDHGAQIAWVEWLISNPDSVREERDLAFPVLMNALEQRAQQAGVILLFTSSDSPSLIKRLSENHKFIPTDKNVTFFMKPVTG